MLGYRASSTSFLMNFEIPEVGTLPGNSVWTETYIAYLSAVWRQIYIKRPYQWELVPVLHTKNCLPAEVVPDLEKTSSLVGCARFTLELFYRPDVVPDLLRIYLLTRSGARFRENFVIVIKLCPIYTKTFLPNKRFARFTLELF